MMASVSLVYLIFCTSSEEQICPAMKLHCILGLSRFRGLAIIVLVMVMVRRDKLRCASYGKASTGASLSLTDLGMAQS